MSGGTGNGPPLPPGVPPHDLSLWDVGQFFLGGAAAWLVLSLIRFALDSIRSGLQTTETEFKIALESTDLALLSRYLKAKLGSVTVHDYVGKSIPRERVDLYVAKLTEFVGSNAVTSSADSAPPPDAQSRPDPTQTDSHLDDVGPENLVAIDPYPEDSPILRSAREMVENGSIWTALATLRRDIEQRLQPLASGRTLRTDDVALRFGPETAKNFERFRRVANRAVHGEDVQIESARAAINSARRVYQAIENTP